MTNYLVFRLYGPMAAWGDIAVGETRPSTPHPSKSATLGLIAAALGIRREEEARQRALADGYGFAVRVDSPGVPLTDYHTVQVPSSGSGRNRRSFATRRDEIVGVPKHELNTILSRRDYRMDALYAVALWEKGVCEQPLQALAEALNRPTFGLYLGRKSCPLALPVEAQLVVAPTILDALNRASFKTLPQLKFLPQYGSGELYWEDGGEAGLPAQQVFQRRDQPLSRARWQFSVRREHHAGGRNDS